MKKTKMEKGITLIALIITIVVLLILAVVAINSITNDGLLGKAENSTSKYNESVKNEQDILGNYENYLNNHMFSKKIQEEEYINYMFTVYATQATVEESSNNNGYTLEKLGYNIQPVFFTDSASVSFKIKYRAGNISSKTIPNCNIIPVAIKPSGTLDIELSGDINNDDEYLVDWNTNIEKKIILKNSGTLALQYRVSFTDDITNGLNLAKYITVSVKDENGQEIDDLNNISGTLSANEEIFYKLIFEMKE